jgi:hypothetical protein
MGGHFHHGLVREVFRLCNCLCFLVVTPTQGICFTTCPSPWPPLRAPTSRPLGDMMRNSGTTIRAMIRTYHGAEGMRNRYCVPIVLRLLRSIIFRPTHASFEKNSQAANSHGNYPENARSPCKLKDANEDTDHSSDKGDIVSPISQTRQRYVPMQSVLIGKDNGNTY